MSQGELFTSRTRCPRGRKAKRSGKGKRSGCSCRGGACSCVRGGQRTRSARTKLSVAILGTATEIIYRGSDGQLYRHKFGKSARLYRTVQGSQLVIAPVRVQEFIV